VRGLVKSFGEVVALDGLDLEVEAGTVFGLLGPNGAGKTKLVRILARCLHRAPEAPRCSATTSSPSPGSAAANRPCGQLAAVDGELSGRENVEMIARLYRLRGSKRDAAPTRCSSGSGWSTRPTVARRPTPAACADVSTSPRG